MERDEIKQKRAIEKEARQAGTRWLMDPI